jgi:hypothetical protein
MAGLFLIEHPSRHAMCPNGSTTGCRKIRDVFPNSHAVTALQDMPVSYLTLSGSDTTGRDELLPQKPRSDCRVLHGW